MDCINLKLGNGMQINFDVKRDAYVCKNGSIRFIKDGKKEKTLFCDNQTVKTFARRIDAAREDRLVDCSDLHGQMT